VDEKLNKALNLFYKKNYKDAKEIFIEINEPYEAGLCSLLLQDLKEARKFFEIKQDCCMASDFGIKILNILEDKGVKPFTYFQVRSFLEIYINLLIENNLFEWAEKIIACYGFFTNSNPEAPKFIARVLNANNYNKTVHFFAQTAKNTCYYDAEIYYIDAELYIKEKNYNEAKKCIDECLSFAPEYYPLLRLKEKLETLSA